MLGLDAHGKKASGDPSFCHGLLEAVFAPSSNRLFNLKIR
jgi:hypothetical protein